MLGQAPDEARSTPALGGRGTLHLANAQLLQGAQVVVHRHARDLAKLRGEAGLNGTDGAGAVLRGDRAEHGLPNLAVRVAAGVAVEGGGQLLTLGTHGNFLLVCGLNFAACLTAIDIHYLITFPFLSSGVSIFHVLRRSFQPWQFSP